MTNGETPTAEHGALAEAATIAALTTDSIATTDQPAEPTEPKPPSFDDFGLHPDVKLALDDMGYFAPTPVQTAVYKPVSEGKDLLVQSRTGTGKTTAFGLPLVNRMVPTHRAPQALILCPTRELALQVAREITMIGKHRGILTEAVYGGAPIGKQIKALHDGVHVVVGTPGRVLDHIGRRTLDCSTVETFVLDECDEMLSMGFLEDIERIASHLPEKRQTLLFSATMPDQVLRYARRHMRAPEQISLSRDSISVAEIHHAYYIVSGIARSRDLLKILFAEHPESAIIFCNTRDETTMVAKFLQKQGLDAEPLSSDLSQADRERVMARTKAKNLRFLCATDVAARGIDISDLSHVINYSVPEAPEIYVHRTGRTGRAGKRGTALSLVGPRELGNFRYVRLQFGIKFEERVLPKDDIFEGKLKVPLPPVGVPQPPDPVQIMIRGVAGTASELERQIFEKLLGSANGKRVLAQLVAEKLDVLSTRTRPRRERRPEREERRPDRDDHAPPHAHAHGDAEPHDGREARGDDDRRPPRFDRDRDRDRPRFDRDRGERGDRGQRRDGEPRFGDRDRSRFDRGGDRDRDRDRGDRPRFGRDRDRDRDRDRGDRGDRDRSERRDRDEPKAHVEVAAAQDVTAPPPVSEAVVEMTAAEPVREHRDEPRRDHRDEPRRDHRDEPRREHRDREPREAHDAPAKVDEVARAALDRADDHGRKKRDRRSEPTAETREFWETWAEEKTSRPAEAEPAADAPAAAAEDEAPVERKRDRGDRKRGRDRDRDTKPERTRAKRDTTVQPREDAAAADSGQTRLFVSLGKKHGVSAEDLRTLLAGPIGGDTSRIGSVSLRDSHAHVRVPEELVETIITGVHGTLHGEHNVTVERSRT